MPLRKSRWDIAALVVVVVCVGSLLVQHLARTKEAEQRAAASNWKAEVEEAVRNDPGFKKSAAGLCLAQHRNDHWTVADCEAIAAHKIRIGMDTAQVTASVGAPDRINRNRNRDRELDQWVYANAYLYFEGGVLTSYQTLGSTK